MLSFELVAGYFVVLQRLTVSLCKQPFSISFMFLFCNVFVFKYGIGEDATPVHIPQMNLELPVSTHRMHSTILKFAANLQ